MEIPFKSLFITSKLPEKDIPITTEDTNIVVSSDNANMPLEKCESEEDAELSPVLVVANKLVDDVVYLYTQTGWAISLELQERIRAFKKMLD